MMGSEYAKVFPLPVLSLAMRSCWLYRVSKVMYWMGKKKRMFFLCSTSIMAGFLMK